MRKGYDNFTVAIFFTIRDTELAADHPELLDEKLNFIEKHLNCTKVYLETYRGNHLIAKEKILKLKDFFTERGYQTSGAITTSVYGNWEFKSFCYTNQEHLAELAEVVRFTAEIFDEIILDDFYFTNCKCESCIKAKGERTWSQFRTDLMKEVSSDIVMKTAKAVNPKVNMIIKYPNWYEDYQSTGYNLEAEPLLFDTIYTGTETRNPTYTQQNLQRYISYFLLRYLENVKPGKNGGGWFDTFDCLYNMGSYVEQAYLTLFAKSREVTLFCAGLLLTRGSIFVPLAGHVFAQVDQFLGQLGAPLGVPCYKPYHSKGESYLHGYLGMLGIPLEPAAELPSEGQILFLTENAAGDDRIVEKIEARLRQGWKVVITSGLLRELQGRGIEGIAEVRYTDKKVAVQEFGYPMYECSFGHYCRGAQPVLIPQLEFSTNDTWQMIVGFKENNSFPLLLKAKYAEGALYILTVPENPGDFYHLPEGVLNELRRVLTADLELRIEGPANIGLFLYDNRTFIVESFLPYFSDVRVIIDQPGLVLTDLVSGEQITGDTLGSQTIFTLKLEPTTYRVFRYT
ncbi:MAG TPA: permease [Bacillota bacterium]